MLKCILFDLDGTLVDTLPDIAQAMNNTLTAFGLPTKALSEYRRFIGGGSQQMVEAMVEPGMVTQVYQAYLTQYEQNLCDLSSPYQGVAALLAQLKQRQIKLAVITNKHHRQAKRILGELFADIEFDAVHGYLAPIAKKPNPQSTVKVLQQLNIQPQHCLFVGDTAIDMQTAKAADIQSVFVRWGYGQIHATQSYLIDHNIDDIEQLNQTINRFIPGNTMTLSQQQKSQPIQCQIADIIAGYLLNTSDSQFENKGRAYLESQLQYFTEQNRAIQLLLPGFPCKSPNDIDKAFSDMPDYGEVSAIEQLDKLCFDINAIYPPGSELTILSDGTTFADVVEVKDETKERYKQALRGLTVTENIDWAELPDILPKLEAEADEGKTRKALLKLINKGPRPFERFVESVKKDPKQSAVHDKMCSYLYHDINLERFSRQCRDGYLASIADKAYQMMYRGKALNKGIDNTYPHHIRLSVHQYDNAGPKFTFALNPNNDKAIAPWHSVPVRLKDGRFVQLPNSIAKEHLLALVTLGGQNWLYLEVESAHLSQFTFEIIKAPRFGLRISDPQNIGIHHFSAQLLKSLSETFGFVVFKNAPIQAQSDLVEFCQPFGEIYQWQFGPVHVVKPQKVPDGFVHSIHKTPLHWDLSMLPKSDENVQKDPRFAASTFMLYCKTPPAAGEGQTTLVDSRTALKLAGQKKVARWKQTEITYETKMTYFGGDPHTYPLVFAHPQTREDIFRYQEGSELDIQQFTLNNDKLSDDELHQLIEDVNGIAYHPRCLVEHEWQAGDLVIIDNFYTLHGRQPMSEKSMSRELWRVQAY